MQRSIAARLRYVQDPRVTLLDTLLSLETDAETHEWLEHFVSTALAEAGVWSSRRVSDGIVYCRFVQHDLMRVGICGRIWDIDQTQHAFWLDVKSDPSNAKTSWILSFDLDTSSLSTRQARHVLEAISDPTEGVWRVELSGHD